MSLEEGAAIASAWPDPRLERIELIEHFDYGRGYTVLLTFENGTTIVRQYCGPISSLMPQEFSVWLRAQIPAGYRLPGRQESEPKWIIRDGRTWR